MKRITVLSFIALGVSAFAQTIGNSPYAAYGIGDVKYDNSIDISSMGGISTAYINDFNNNFNFRNPAANTNFDLTSFQISGTNENNYYKSDYQNIKATKHSNYLSNISFAFPLSPKLKFGLGYQPYSSKAYEILTSKTLADNSIEANKFTGKGTLSTVQAAVGYKISNEFSLGLRSNFYFGKLYDTEELTFSGAELINGYETSNKVQSFNFTAGTAYQKTLKNDKKLTLGATYTFGTTGKMETYYKNSTYYYAGIDQKTNESIIEEKKSTENNLLPQEFSFGVGYGNEGKWFYSTQLDYKKGESIQFLGQPFNFQNSYKISAGGWYLPNYNNFRNYFSRVIYRFGAYYEKGNLSISPMASATSSNVNRYAVTAGVSLPFATSNINRLNGLDIGIELGKRGTLENNMIRQNFVNLKIGLNFADKWFQKRQYD
ncbi:MAG: hypothetical protein Q4G16_06115 [Cruoricaptor ignavus]|nr:hypothetical protein [Cruoricaptor ignavus]